MKATGAEINDFYKNHWPKGFYHEDWDASLVSDDKEEFSLADDQAYDLKDLGFLVSETDGKVTPFSSAFSKWKKAQTTTLMTLRIPKDKKDDFIALVKGAGYKVEGS